MTRINLHDSNIMSPTEASKRYGKAEGYVRIFLYSNNKRNLSKKKLPKGSYRKFGHTTVVTTEFMDFATGKKDSQAPHINLGSKNILSATEAAKIWNKSTDYVRHMIYLYPKRLPKNSWRKVGSTILVTTDCMESMTGQPDPRKKTKK